MKSKTYGELLEIAKQKNVKNYRKYKKHELEKMFDFEEIYGEKKFFEKYCKRKWQVTPVLARYSNGEEKRFKSLYATGKYFGIFPQNIKQKIFSKRSMEMKNGDILWFSYIQN